MSFYDEETDDEEEVSCSVLEPVKDPEQQDEEIEECPAWLADIDNDSEEEAELSVLAAIQTLPGDVRVQPRWSGIYARQLDEEKTCASYVRPFV